MIIVEAAIRSDAGPRRKSLGKLIHHFQFTASSRQTQSNPFEELPRPLCIQLSQFSDIISCVPRVPQVSNNTDPTVI